MVVLYSYLSGWLFCGLGETLLFFEDSVDGWDQANELVIKQQVSGHLVVMPMLLINDI